MALGSERMMWAGKKKLWEVVRRPFSRKSKGSLLNPVSRTFKRGQEKRGPWLRAMRARPRLHLSPQNTHTCMYARRARPSFSFSQRAGDSYNDMLLHVPSEKRDGWWRETRADEDPEECGNARALRLGTKEKLNDTGVSGVRQTLEAASPRIATRRPPPSRLGQAGNGVLTTGIHRRAHSHTHSQREGGKVGALIRTCRPRAEHSQCPTFVARIPHAAALGTRAFSSTNICRFRYIARPICATDSRCSCYIEWHRTRRDRFAPPLWLDLDVIVRA